MKTKLTLIGTMALACAASQLAAMPTEKETRRAEPVVRRMLAHEKAALNSGKKTRSEVAMAAINLAGETDTDAAKLLLMKGAFVLYVQDGNIEKAAETLDALETAIPDIPPQYVKNMVDTAFLGVRKKKDSARLYKLLAESKKADAESGAAKAGTPADESAAETRQNAFARLFPGWHTSVEPVAKSSHRGQDDVVFVHPPSQETPAVVSRTLTLSNGNPCLFLKMASFDKGTDFLLSVLVNGEEVLPKRLIRTPDSEPWQDITVPLSAWRGEKVKIDIVLTANDWWCEHPFFKRLEVAEGARQEKFASEAKDIKYKFSYKLEDEFAVITEVEPKPVGKLVVPYEIDGHTVVQIGGYNDNVFGDCDQMTGIVLPAGLELETFDPGVFMRCKSLASIEVSKANLDFASLDGVLYSKDFSMLCVYPKTRESISLSPMTKRIMRCAFRGCALKTAQIPEGIEEIEKWNLCECPNLESVEFPKSLKRLDCCAVAHSDNVKKMVFNGDAPRVDPTYYTSGLVQGLFTGAPADLVVEVREGTKGWKSPDSVELPARWPTNQKETRPIRFKR